MNNINDLVNSFFNTFGKKVEVYELDGRYRLAVKINSYLIFATKWWPTDKLCYEDAWRSITGHDFELYDFLAIDNPKHSLIECNSEAELILKLTALGQTESKKEEA